IETESKLPTMLSQIIDFAPISSAAKMRFRTSSSLRVDTCGNSFGSSHAVDSPIFSAIKNPKKIDLIG
ncbi:MAG: hypothetical protein EBX19_09615, partial [Actinobacteria bacterium]|nr:hypothetical protein [Actinomycetota bacterium]